MTEGQKTAFDTGWSRYGLSLFNGRLDIEQAFGRQAPLVLEIGFGMGDSLLQQAVEAPDTNFIGIEVHPPGVGRLLHMATSHHLDNLRVYMADANDVLGDCIDAASLDRVQVFFPDPWHKKKHHKRRIIQPEFVAAIGHKLKPGGVLHLATDWQNYAEYMLEVLSAADGFESLGGPTGYVERPAYRPKTKFENRGERLGHGVWDILFRKV